MQFKEYTREKDGKIQAILNYRYENKRTWQQTSKQGFTNKKDIKKWFSDKRFELMELEKLNLVDESMTLEALILEYIENIKLRNKGENTIIAYNQLLSFFEPIKNWEIKEITPHSLEKYFFKKQKEIGYTYDNYLKNIGSVFNFAINKLRILRDNPAKDVFIEKDTKDERIKFISEDLHKQIIKDCKNETLILFIETLYNTGVRISEGLGITSKNILLDRIIIDKQYYNGKFSQLKNHKSFGRREVPISTDLSRELKRQIVNIEDRIFYKINWGTTYYHLQKYETSAHCYRHTYITRLHYAGVNDKTISQIVGDTIETIRKIYLQFSLDEAPKEFEKIRNISNF